MPEALVLAPEAPYPLAGGGPMRTASIFEYLKDRYSVDAILFREPGAPDPRDAFPHGTLRDSLVLDLPYHSRRLLARAARNLSRMARGQPPLNDRFNGFSRPVAEWLDRRSYRLAIFEHFWCAPYVQQIGKHAAETVLDLHNIESLLYSRLAEAEPWPLSLALRRFGRAARAMERTWFPRFSRLLAASDEDAGRARGLAPGADVLVYPNAIPQVECPIRAEQNVIVFPGNFEYGPNLSAVRFFRHEIWPRLRKEEPGLVWRLVGKNPHAVAKLVAGDPRIELTGPVENAIEELAAARLVVVPLLAGSGTRIKILEAWAAARAVVSTALGAEGLGARDGEHLVLAHSAPGFSDAILELLADGARRRCLGEAGHALYKTRFTWQSVWQNLAIIGL